MHLPADTALFAQDWLFENFLAKQFEQLPNSSVSFRSINFDDVKRASLYHRTLLRLLSHNIDPNIFIREEGRRRLIDVIRIPAKLRRSFLPMDLEMHRVSKTIGSSTIKKFAECDLMPLTPARDGAWAYRNPPWEIWEHHERKMTKQDIDVERQASHSEMLCSSKNGLLKSKGKPGKTGAHHRFRSWPTPSSLGWWHG